MARTGSVLTVGKLEAAHRQLRTAISLWFNDGDPVSIHTLAFAAHEIFDAVSKKRDPYRRDMLFDSALIKDEYRREFVSGLKKHANFFKHADHDSDAEIEFNPLLTEGFILFAILGRSLCGSPRSDEESTFSWWLQIHKPNILTENGRKMVAAAIPIDNLEYLRGLSKPDFFGVFHAARQLINSGRPSPAYVVG